MKQKFSEVPNFEELITHLINLQHANLIQVHEYFESQLFYYIITEFFPAQRLATVI